MESIKIRNIIREQTQPVDREEIVDQFLSFCQDKLGYSTPASVMLVDDRNQLKTLASYNLQTNEVKVYSKNRALADILRSIAHELVHHQQLEDGRIDLNNLPQDVGGEIEDEANAVAGQLVKEFGYNDRNIYENWDKSMCADANQGEFFCQDKGENLGISDIYKDDGHNLIHGFAEKFHLSDVTPESEETYNDPTKVKPKENNFKPNLRKGPFSIRVQNKDLLTLINEEKDPHKLKLVQEVIQNQLKYLKKEKVLEEQYNEGEQPDTVNSVDVKMMHHIIRDYSQAEIEHMVNQTDIEDLDLRPILKLYGFSNSGGYFQRGTEKAKQLTQFIYDNNYNVSEDDIGKPLPPLNEYTVVQSVVIVERQIKDYKVIVKDTNFNSIMCTLAREWWQYEPDMIATETIDEDFIGDEEWVSVHVNGQLKWDNNEIKASKDKLNKFSPFNRECDD
tara:strand:+ start:45 stop:1388 length:1344 start_codon:yes stop_codon:yes gene_type:complete